jgi:hypothetical protein
MGTSEQLCQFDTTRIAVNVLTTHGLKLKQKRSVFLQFTPLISKGKATHDVYGFLSPAGPIGNFALECLHFPEED